MHWTLFVLEDRPESEFLSDDQLPRPVTRTFTREVKLVTESSTRGSGGRRLVGAERKKGIARRVPITFVSRQFFFLLLLIFFSQLKRKKLQTMLNHVIPKIGIC